MGSSLGNSKSQREIFRAARYVAKWCRKEVLILPEHRKAKGRRWKAAELLKAALLGLMSGCKSFKDVEQMTEAMSPAMKKAAGITRRVPDTTLWDYFKGSDACEVRELLHRQTKELHYSRTLPQCAAGHAPITHCAIDGKYGPAVHKAGSSTAYPYFQAKSQLSDERHVRGEVRVVSVSLVSGEAPFFLDAVPVPGKTSEMGIFPVVLESLLGQWKQCGLVDLISMDAGSVSKAHAKAVDQAGLLYLMAVKGMQKELYAELRRQLGYGDSACADFRLEESYQGHRVVTSVWVSHKVAGWNEWQHLRCGIRVERRTYYPDKPETHEDRYFVTNAQASRLTPKQWQMVVRNHWLVENQCHCVLDVSWEEDRRPWSRDPHIKLIVALLRRLAFNLLSAFRLHMRSEKNRSRPWKELLRLFRRALEQAGEDILVGLKQKPETAKNAAA